MKSNNRRDSKHERDRDVERLQDSKPRAKAPESLDLRDWPPPKLKETRCLDDP